MKLSAILLLLFVGTSVVSAIPQYTLLSGNRCNTCHVASQGSGLRNELGWYSRSDAALIPPTSPAISWLYSSHEGNDYLDGKLLVGMDVRLQSTRSPFDSAAQRRTIPMQSAIHAAWLPMEGVTLLGMMNLSAINFGNGPSARYAGQRAAHVSAIIQPSFDLPSIRIGYFRPSTGMLYDDHTMFAYNAVASASRLPLLPPNWAEAGAEVTYDSPLWLTLSAGIFGSNSLSQVRGPANAAIVVGNGPTITARAVFWPRLFNEAVNSWAGASYLVNGEFAILSTFVGIGLNDVATLMLDHTESSRDNAFSTSNFTAEVLFNLHQGAMPFLRWEQGTSQIGTSRSSASAAVIGAQVFPIPFVEIRPEYRIWNTDLPGYAARWNVQLHLYY